MKRTFVCFPEFESLWKSIHLSDEDMRELETYLLPEPDKGAVIQGTGGLRKLRWKIPGKGKRGGIRILYIDFPLYEQTFFISLIKKNEKDNISNNDKKIISRLIKEIEINLNKGRNYEKK